MHVTVLSKVLELAANLAYWTALWLVAKLFGRGAEPSGVEAGGERDRVLTVRASTRRTTVVIVRSEEGADDVIVAIGETR